MSFHAAVESLMAEKYQAVPREGRKSLGNFLIGKTHAVNVLSTNIEKKNYSPNVVSAKRLLRWLQKGNQYSLLLASYKEVRGVCVMVEASGLFDIQLIDWDCMAIEAQGWGVIQMPRPVKVNHAQTGDEFWEGFRRAYTLYADKQRAKLTKIDELVSGFPGGNAVSQVPIQVELELNVTSPHGGSVEDARQAGENTVVAALQGSRGIQIQNIVTWSA